MPKVAFHMLEGLPPVCGLGSYFANNLQAWPESAHNLPASNCRLVRSELESFVLRNIF